MRRIAVVLACLWPVLVSAEEARTYTNADLVSIEVPGAYTNQDLKRLSPMPMQKQPAAVLPPFAYRPEPAEGYQAVYDSLARARAELAAEIVLERKRIAFSESAFAGGATPGEPRLGYRVRVQELLLDLEKRVVLLDMEIEEILDEARRAGVTIVRR